MIDSKIFRVPYYPNQAYLDFSRLDPHEIGILMQIINLIYMNQGAIENDPKWISRSFLNFGTSKTRNVIGKLLQNGNIYLTDEGKISQKMSEKQLKNVRNTRETQSKHGKKGAETRWENEQNQELNSSNPKSDAIASNSDSNSTNPLTPLKGGSRSKRKTYQEKKNEAIDSALTKSGYYELEKQIADHENNSASQDPENEDRDNLIADQSEL